jgi:hypothetical protein
MTLTITPTLIAIAAAYVLMALLLLSMNLSSRFAWWLKATAIVITSAFFIEVFFASKNLLGWPAYGGLPPKFQLLWSRVVEPDPKMGSKGSIYLWVEEVDENNVPSGLPRAIRLPYSVKLAERSLKARDEIMNGNPQEGTSEEMGSEEANAADARAQKQLEQQDGGITSTSTGQVNLDDILAQIPRVEFRPMTGPVLPPKP